MVSEEREKSISSTRRHGVNYDVSRAATPVHSEERDSVRRNPPSRDNQDNLSWAEVKPQQYSNRTHAPSEYERGQQPMDHLSTKSVGDKGYAIEPRTTDRVIAARPYSSVDSSSSSSPQQSNKHSYDSHPSTNRNPMDGAPMRYEQHGEKSHLRPPRPSPQYAHPSLLDPYMQQDPASEYAPRHQPPLHHEYVPTTLKRKRGRPRREDYGDRGGMRRDDGSVDYYDDEDDVSDSRRSVHSMREKDFHHQPKNMPNIKTNYSSPALQWSEREYSQQQQHHHQHQYQHPQQHHQQVNRVSDRSSHRSNYPSYPTPHSGQYRGTRGWDEYNNNNENNPSTIGGNNNNSHNSHSNATMHMPPIFTPPSNDTHHHQQYRHSGQPPPHHSRPYYPDDDRESYHPPHLELEMSHATERREQRDAPRDLQREVPLSHPTSTSTAAVAVTATEDTSSLQQNPVAGSSVNYDIHPHVNSTDPRRSQLTMESLGVDSRATDSWDDARNPGLSRQQDNSSSKHLVDDSNKSMDANTSGFYENKDENEVRLKQIAELHPNISNANPPLQTTPATSRGHTIDTYAEGFEGSNPNLRVTPPPQAPPQAQPQPQRPPRPDSSTSNTGQIVTSDNTKLDPPRWNEEFMPSRNQRYHSDGQDEFHPLQPPPPLPQQQQLHQVPPPSQQSYQNQQQRSDILLPPPPIHDSSRRAPLHNLPSIYSTQGPASSGSGTHPPRPMNIHSTANEMLLDVPREDNDHDMYNPNPMDRGGYGSTVRGRESSGTHLLHLQGPEFSGRGMSIETVHEVFHLCC